MSKYTLWHLAVRHERKFTGRVPPGGWPLGPRERAACKPAAGAQGPSHLPDPADRGSTSPQTQQPHLRTQGNAHLPER